MSGTRISSTFDGMWVKTIVLIEPEPGRDPCRRQRRDRGQQVREEEDRAEDRGLDAVLEMEPVGHQALRDEPAAEGVDREQDRQLEHDAASTAPRPKRRRMPSVDDGRRRRLDGRAEPPEADRHRDPDDRIADDDGAVGVERCDRRR